MKKIVKKHLKSQQFALEGLIDGFKSELNFRLEILISLILSLAAFVLRFDLFEWFMLLTAIVLVMALELVNTAIEYLCDTISPEFNTAIKHAKDISAAAVLLAAFYSIAVGIIILVHYYTRCCM